MRKRVRNVRFGIVLINNIFILFLFHSLSLSLYCHTEEDDNQDYIHDAFVVDENEEEKECKKQKLVGEAWCPCGF
jgi:hypothetical protein